VAQLTEGLHDGLVPSDGSLQNVEAHRDLSGRLSLTNSFSPDDKPFGKNLFFFVVVIFILIVVIVFAVFGFVVVIGVFVVGLVVAVVLVVAMMVVAVVCGARIS